MTWDESSFTIAMNVITPEETPRSGFADKKLKSPCPAVPQRGPDAGEHHKTIFIDPERIR